MPRQLLPALAAALVVLISVVPAHAQTARGSAEIKIDSPIADSTINNGTEVVVGGWAIDPAGPGSGVDEVRVYLDGEMDRGGIMLGRATYPKPRPDVAQVKGNTAFANSGYDYIWRPRNLSPGPHRIYVYARSIANGWTWQSVNVNGPSRGGGMGDYGMYGPMTPYGGGYLSNVGYGMGGFGDYPYGPPRCSLPSSYLDPRCAPPPPPPPPPPPLQPIGQLPPISSALPAPTGVTASGITGTAVTLTWLPVPGAATYRVFASVGSTGFIFPATITNVTNTGAIVMGLTPATPYTLRVVAVDTAGNQGVSSAPVTITTAP